MVTGRDEAFEQAFDDLLSRALSAARRIVGHGPAAEDVAAEAMARTFAHWPTVGALPYREAWVVRVAANLAIDCVRRRVVPPGPEGWHAPEDAAVERLTLLGAVGKLPRRQREVIVLSYLSDIAEGDVARLLGISNGSVKTHLHRGLAALRTTLSVASEEPRLAAD